MSKETRKTTNFDENEGGGGGGTGKPGVGDIYL